MGRPRLPVERIWDSIDVGAPDECWPWTGSLDNHGYGRMAVNNDGSRYAHRIVLSLATGVPLMNPLCALHSCDNPPCCNPAHLRWGTKSENSLERHARGRDAAGERHGRRLHPERWIKASPLVGTPEMPS